MEQPSLDLLLSKVDSKYTLVIGTSKRARALIDETNFEEEYVGKKPVSIALREIANGKYQFERTREGIK